MKETYAGKIHNQGSQKVEALFKDSKHGKATVKKGEDLRGGKK